MGLFASISSAHPVAKDTHDRTIVVRLQKGDKPNQIRVRVEYRLEADEGTIRDGDMIPFRDVVNPLNFRGEALKYYAEFAKTYAPIYADHFILRVNKNPLEAPRCISHQERLDDEQGKALGHLRCDFVFESIFELDPVAKTQFSFYEKNYWLQEGQIILSLVNETGLGIEDKKEPDEALRKRVNESPEPGDEDRMREVSVVFVPWAAPEPPKTSTPPAGPERDSRETHSEWFDLERLIFNTDHGFWLIMVLAFLIGAAHALTPGHGKTLVAAYLVGERGTVWHAIYLGVVTTLTHTGVVLGLALIFTLLSQESQQTLKKWIENGLGLVVGLIVVGMGFWLFLQRAAGRADHIHLDGGHHHHHGPGPQGTSAQAARSLNWWGLTVLGMTGGLIPCWDAIGVLFWSVGTKEMWLVFPAVLVFSAGLAAVLVIIGILVVQVPRFVESRYGTGRVLRALPIVSAIAVTLMGLWICYKETRGM